MSNQGPVYVIDANVLMEAHRRYYAFPLCPGFWDCLLQAHKAGHVVSIDKVRNEIQPGDDLHKWVKSSVPAAFFASTQDSAVLGNFSGLVGWVQGNLQFKPEAKAEFAQVADGWLVAYAQAHTNHVVVTMEEHAREAKKKVPLPNVCLEFEVLYTDTFAMLKDLDAKFVLET